MTAKIYTFPVTPKAASKDDRLVRLEAEAHKLRMADFGTGWYHDEAIDKAKNAGLRRS